MADEERSSDNDQTPNGEDEGDIKDDQKPQEGRPDVKTQLDELRPLLDARLQENGTWWIQTRA